MPPPAECELSAAARLQPVRFTGMGTAYAGAIFLLYMAPVLLAGLLALEVGGVAAIGLNGQAAYLRYLTVWALAIIPFLLGAGICRGSVVLREPEQLKSSMWMIVFALSPIVIGLKLMLVSAGVYESYAFDSGLMSGGIWSLSMSFSEMCLFLFAVAVAMGDARLMLATGALIGLNLLHGTRIFAVCAVSIFFFYWISVRTLTLKRLVLAGLAFIAVLFVSFLVFKARSNVELDYQDTAILIEYLVSPIVFESLFSQLALIDLANGVPIALRCTGLDYFYDLVSFLLPRALNPDKDDQCISYLFALQPLGALNGVFGIHAYFGAFSALFFLAFGLLGRFLWTLGRSNFYFLALTLYFFGSLVLRLVRDGPIHAVKYLSVAVFTCLVIAGFDWLNRRLAVHRDRATELAC